jgi:hypothetical protein
MLGLLLDGSAKVFGDSILGLCVEGNFWILDSHHQGASVLGISAFEMSSCFHLFNVHSITQLGIKFWFIMHAVLSFGLGVLIFVNNMTGWFHLNNLHYSQNFGDLETCIKPHSVCKSLLAQWKNTEKNKTILTIYFIF